MTEESIMRGRRLPYAQLVTHGGLNIRYGHWPGRGAVSRGVVLLLQGRGEFMEKYDETVRELRNRDMDVVSLDWRGQGLSDRPLSGGANGFSQYYDRCLSDLDAVINHVIMPLNIRPVIILAHSMGGHIALRYLHRDEVSVTGCVLTAPMIDIVTGPVPGSVARWFCRWQVKRGRGGMAVGGARKYDSYRITFKGNRLTSDRIRFENSRRLVDENPRLAAGCVSYGWLADTFDSIDVLKTAGFAESISVPMMMFIAGKERVVSNAAAYAFVQRLPKAVPIVVHGARHEILQEQDDHRTFFWRNFDHFVGHLTP